MDQYFDKETKHFLLLFAAVAIFLIIIYPRINSGLLALNFDKGFKTLVPASKNLGADTPALEIDQTKNYSAVFDTVEGEFTIDLFEKSAPLNVSNFVSNPDLFINARVTDIKKDFLFKVDVVIDPKVKTKDEINADYIGLDQKKVKDADFLKEQYQNNKETKPFSPDNLDKNENLSLKDFYTRELKYTYNTELTTPKSIKYMVYMANKGPNDNGLDFFIIMSGSAPQVDGRYTPIGQVIKGFEVLDKINASQSTDIFIDSVKINIE